jgi:hypothetical protein
MPRAQKARLREATEDYLKSIQGDGPGHSSRHFDGEPVAEAKALLGRLGGSQDVRGDTPGRRAAGSTGQGAPNFDAAQAQALTE